MAHLADLRTGLTTLELEQLVAALADEIDADGKQATVESVQTVLSATLPRIIAVNWEPESGKNQLDASVSNVIARQGRPRAGQVLAQGWQAAQQLRCFLDSHAPQQLR